MIGKRIYGLIAVSMLMALVLGACGPAATPAPVPTPVTVVETQMVIQTVEVGPQPTPDPLTACTGKTMAYLGFGSQFAFIAIVDKSMQDAAKQYGVNLIFLDNQFSADKAIENAQLVASRSPKPDLVFEFNYYQQMNYQIADIFKEAGIPVIAIDIPVPGATYYGGDNYFAGKLAGEALGAAAADKWGDQKVDLALIEQQSLAGQQTLQARTLGIQAGIQKSLPYLTQDQIVIFEGQNDPNKASEAIAAQLTAHPKAQRIVIGMLGDSNAIASANVANDAKRDALVSGIGGDDVGIKALRDGDPPNFIGTSLFLPEHYGDDLIPLGCRLLAGEQIPAQVFVNHVFLDKNNLNQYYPQ
jgi:ribose transport system substrate-binding protein